MRRIRGILAATSAAWLLAACGPGEPRSGARDEGEGAAATVPGEAASGAVSVDPEPGEGRLSNLRMLTFAGENAEAYWNADGTRLILQATRPGETECDQIFTMDDEGRDLRLVSTGEGRTTCAYFFPDGERVLYSSTHEFGADCPPPPDRSRGYVWALYDYDVYSARPDGSDLRRLTNTPGYDAEATISPDGSRIVFTSVRDGDLEIYTMKADGTDVRRLTHEEGYDGGPFFSSDGTKIVYRAYHPTDPAELEDYRSLLHDGLVRPGTLEIFVMDADGSNKRQVTSNGAANFGPFFHPDGERIIFSSNLHEPDGRDFDLYLIGIDGTGLERVTRHPEFDGFPMFSPDGTRLVFASNRHNRQRGDTNVFVADWVEDRPASASGEAGDSAMKEGS
jgi:Tol biopolymer transport system component